MDLHDMSRTIFLLSSLNQKPILHLIHNPGRGSDSTKTQGQSETKSSGY